MQSMHLKILRKIRTQTYVELLLLAMVLSYLAGCAAEQKIKSAPMEQQSSMIKGHTVERLKDGRDGFIIMEAPQLDEAYRREFAVAVAMLNNREYDRAIEILENIIEQSPGVTAPYIDIAMAYRHVGKLDQAEKHLKTALHLVPEHPAAGNEYGLLCRQTGRFAEARAIYEKAIARFPDYYPIHRNLGILCDLYLNDPACALDHYEIYSKAVPDDQQVKLWIADLRARLGRK